MLDWIIFCVKDMAPVIWKVLRTDSTIMVLLVTNSIELVEVKCLCVGKRGLADTTNNRHSLSVRVRVAKVVSNDKQASRYRLQD